MMKYREWGLSKIEEKKVQLQVGYSTERDGVSTLKETLISSKLDYNIIKPFSGKALLDSAG